MSLKGNCPVGERVLVVVECVFISDNIINSKVRVYFTITVDILKPITNIPWFTRKHENQEYFKTSTIIEKITMQTKSYEERIVTPTGDHTNKLGTVLCVLRVRKLKRKHIWDSTNRAEYFHLNATRHWKGMPAKIY